MNESDETRSVVAAEAAVDDTKEEIRVLTVTVEGQKIETDEQLGSSSALLGVIKKRRRDLEELRMSITRPMDEAKRRVMAIFQPAEDGLLDVEKTLKDAILAYTREQARLQYEAQAKLDDAANRERDRLRRLAEKQRAADHTDRAEVSEERAETVEAPIVQAPSVPKGPVHVRTTWSAEVVDLLELVKACAEGRQPLGLLQPNVVALNDLARIQKDKMEIPGVSAVAKQGVAVRGGR